MALQKKTIGIIAAIVLVVLIVVGAVLTTTKQNADKQQAAAQAEAAKTAAADKEAQLYIEEYGLQLDYEPGPGKLEYTLNDDDRFGAGVTYIEITNPALRDTRDVCDDPDTPSDSIIGRILVESTPPTGDDANAYIKSDDKYLVYQYPNDTTADPDGCSGKFSSQADTQRVSLNQSFTDMVDKVNSQDNQ